MAASSSGHVSPRFEELDARARRRLIARSASISIVLVASMTAAYYVVPWDGGGARAVAVRLSIVVGLLVVATALSVQNVSRSQYPVLRAFEVLSLVLGLAILSFASVYVGISNRDPSAFSEPLGTTDGLYFALTTATTIGYGDIAARTEGARIVVMIQMLTNVAVLGVAARAILQAARRRVDDR